jgi:hypothetical protein
MATLCVTGSASSRHDLLDTYVTTIQRTLIVHHTSRTVLGGDVQRRAAAVVAQPAQIDHLCVRHVIMCACAPTHATSNTPHLIRQLVSHCRLQRRQARRFDELGELCRAIVEM